MASSRLPPERRSDPARRQPPVWRRRPPGAKFQPRRSCSPSREESNDGTHETKSALLRRRRMGPEPGPGVSGSQDRHCSRSSGAITGAGSRGRSSTATGRRAKRQADEVAAGFAVHEPASKAEAEPEPLTLERLFDIYREEVTPTKGDQSQRHDRAAMTMFLKLYGRNRDPATLSQRDWDRFILARRAGKIGPSGRPVSDRMIECDLRFLIAVFNWAAKSRDEQGRPLLVSNPFRGLRIPTEKNPTRVVLSEEEYQALLKVSEEVDWRFRVALVLSARDRTPYRGRPAASLDRHRLRRQDHPVARGAREDRVRTPYTRDRRGGRRVGVGAEGQYLKWRRPGDAVPEE